MFLVEIGVRGGEGGDRAVEAVALAEIGSERDPVARASVRARERPAACRRIGSEPVRQNRLDVDRALSVPKLAHVEVARPTVEIALGATPAEEDVARRLHQPLALDHALAVVREAAAAE